jgi:hypothetical protein
MNAWRQRDVKLSWAKDAAEQYHEYFSIINGSLASLSLRRRQRHGWFSSWSEQTIYLAGNIKIRGLRCRQHRKKSKRHRSSQEEEYTAAC